MPIVRDNTPFGAVGELAYAAGVGEYNRYRQQLALEQQRLGMAQDQQMIQAAQHQADREQQAQQNNQQMQARAYEANQGRQFDAWQRQQQFGQQVGMSQLQFGQQQHLQGQQDARQLAAQEAAAGQRNAYQQAAFEQQNQISTAQRAAMAQRAKYGMYANAMDNITAMTKAGMQYTPEDQAAIKSLDGNLTKIQNDPAVDDEQRASAEMQYWAQRSRITPRQPPAKTFKEEAAEAMIDLSELTGNPEDEGRIVTRNREFQIQNPRKPAVAKPEKEMPLETRMKLRGEIYDAAAGVSTAIDRANIAYENASPQEFSQAALIADRARQEFIARYGEVTKELAPELLQRLGIQPEPDAKFARVPSQSMPPQAMPGQVQPQAPAQQQQPAQILMPLLKGQRQALPFKVEIDEATGLVATDPSGESRPATDNEIGQWLENYDSEQSVEQFKAKYGKAQPAQPAQPPPPPPKDISALPTMPGEASKKAAWWQSVPPNSYFRHSDGTIRLKPASL